MLWLKHIYKYVALFIILCQKSHVVFHNSIISLFFSIVTDYNSIRIFLTDITNSPKGCQICNFPPCSLQRLTVGQSY